MSRLNLNYLMNHEKEDTLMDDASHSIETRYNNITNLIIVDKFIIQHSESNLKNFKVTFLKYPEKIKMWLVLSHVHTIISRFKKIFPNSYTDYNNKKLVSTYLAHIRYYIIIVLLLTLNTFFQH